MQYVASVQATIASFPTDLVIAATVLIVLFAIIAWRKNRRFISTAIAFYPAIVLYNYIPYPEQVFVASSPMALYINKLAIFIALVMLMYLMVTRFARRHTGSSTKATKTLTALGLALILVIEGYIVVTTIIPIGDLYTLSPLAVMAFSESIVFFWLLAIPVILYGISYL